MKSKYFKIQELVSEEVYKKYKEKAWEFIKPEIILFLDSIREFYGKPVIVNNWLYGGNLKQRGLRANKDEMVKSKKDFYLSQHCLGGAVDFNVQGVSPEDVAKHILKNEGHYRNFISRIENPKQTPTWTHVDCANTEEYDKLIIFNA